MSDHKVRFYGYVERPYGQVSALLREQPLELLQRATHSASTRARALVANLRVNVGAVEVAVDVRTHIDRVAEEEGVAGMSPITSLEFGWEAARAPGFFPLMKARLSAWPLTSTETQLQLEGDYAPPLGPLGVAIDTVVGHRIAEASVERLLQDVIEQIRREPRG